jgi:hypothetical protein
LSVETKGEQTRPSAADEASPKTGERDHAEGPDYFTDAVPLAGDSERREREERVRRLEAARPRRSRIRKWRPRAGVVAVLAVVLGACGLAILGRSSHRESSGVRRPSAGTATEPTRRPEASTPVIGLAPAVAVATPRPHTERRKARVHHRRRPIRHQQDEPGEIELSNSGGEPEPPAPTEPAQQEEAPPAEVTIESAPDAEPEPPPEPAPEPSPETAAPASPSTKEGGAKSSSSEANSQFGFGR